MRYFFQCGNFADLSLAELVCVFESYGLIRDSIKNQGNGIFLIESNSIEVDDLRKVFKRLGGFIRYGLIIDNLEEFLPSFSENKKVVFGISVLNDTDIERKSIEKLSNDIKRSFREMGVSSRFVVPKGKELNEAQIRNNMILEEGFEFCIFDTKAGQLYGRTFGIQDVEAFVKRDLDKPVSDYSMGVLPQKLARIMCNLTGRRDGILWDPFCGSGTVLMEAAVLGFDILGSDIDEKAIFNSDKNIQWLRDEGLITGIRYNLFSLDIKNVERKVVKDLKRTNINAVVCEPFMGPPQKKILTDSKASLLLKDVESLYKHLFMILDQVVNSGFTAVIVIPSYRAMSGEKGLNVSQVIDKKWEVVNRKYTKGDLKWKRNNSIITRNIFILSKR